MALTLRSKLLSEHGLLHGFSLRAGGVSGPPFDPAGGGLNLARTLGDDPAAVAENHERLAREVGYPAEQLYEVSQVHGRSVQRIDATQSASAQDVAAVRLVEADALITTVPGGAVAVRVADCLPVLLADPVAGQVAAAHAGWRGAAAGILESTVASMQAAGAEPARLTAAVGPHIGPCCFEVGEEVAEALAASAGGFDPVVARKPKPYVDLGAVVQRQLLQLGVAASRIDVVPGCTHCDARRFFSYRRDGAASGRQLAVIVGPSPTPGSSEA